MPAPLLVSTWSFGLRGNTVAWPALAVGGASLDAVETVCRVAEADERVDSVGIGGLPDRAGAVSLEASVMCSPSRRGSVCGVRRHLHPVSIARRLMERTPLAMLAGDGADDFADAEGFESLPLLSDRAKRWWLAHDAKMQARREAGDDRGHLLRPVDDGGGAPLFGALPKAPAGHDTIGVLALDHDGGLAGACSTSGMPYKAPGRVGDAPLIGHGLYVDPIAGAATATGTGELVMGLCSSFLAVEMMRRGAAPIDALVEALGRIDKEMELRPEHQVGMIAIDPRGALAAASLRPGYRISIHNERVGEVREPEVVLLPS